MRGNRTRTSYGPHRQQHGDLWLPSEHRDGDRVPLVVLFHGGFWRAVYTARLMDLLAADLVARGWAAWNLEYRRVGTGGGGGGWPATYHDARDGLRAVSSLAGVDTDRVVTCGHSAGGHLALWTAAEARRTTGHDRIVPVAAVSLAGVVDVVSGADQQLGDGAVQRLMGGEPHEREDRYRDASLLDALPLGLPQVLVHGAADDVVPPAMATAYAERAWASGDTVEVLLIDGADHMSMIDPSSPAWSATLEQLGRHLS